jgi:hypothetical protein
MVSEAVLQMAWMDTYLQVMTLWHVPSHHQSAINRYRLSQQSSLLGEKHSHIRRAAARTEVPEVLWLGVKRGEHSNADR